MSHVLELELAYELELELELDLERALSDTCERPTRTGT